VPYAAKQAFNTEKSANDGAPREQCHCAVALRNGIAQWHCEARSAEAIPRLTSLRRLVRRGIVSSLRASQ